MTEIDKCLDAGIGRQGAVFSLVRLDGLLYVHVNVSEGYLVFRALPETEPLNVKVNNFLADLYEQGKCESQQQLDPEKEREIWSSDERPEDVDNPCDVCQKRMPLNPLTAIFGCHYECRETEREAEHG